MRLTVAHWMLVMLACTAASCIKEVPLKILVGSDASGPDAADVDVGDGQAETEALVPEEISDVADVPSPDGGKDLVEPELVEQAEHVVGPAGGTFLFPAGAVLVVPAGALSKDVTIGVVVSTQGVPDGMTPVSGLFELSPAGTKFSKTVILRVPLTDAPAIDDEDWARVKGYLGSVGQFEAVPAWPDIAAGQVWIQLSHFSLVFAGVAEEGSSCLGFELCNGKDDDCDGTTDEEPSFSELAGCKTKGICTGLTKVACEEGQWACDYSATNPVYFEEDETLCDDKDNDCDGLTDEGIGGDIKDYPQALCKQKGVCQGATIKVACVAGKWFCDYSKVPSFQGSEELLCDGKDNDCDGGLDEGICTPGDECLDDAACKVGHCALPLGGVDVSFCTEGADSCLAVDDGAQVVEVKDGGHWCGEDGKSVLTCEGGTWAKPFDCAIDFPLNPKCDPVALECTGGCDKDEECEDNGNYCDGDFVCLAGICTLDKGTIVFCPDSDTCSDFACEPATGKCLTVPKNEGGSCDDQDTCTGAGKCAKGKCEKGAQIDCSDPNPCTFDFCSDVTGKCAHDPLPNIGLPCDDANGCTNADVCTDDGSCDGALKPCSDGNPCTEDGCDPATGQCTAVPQVGGECEDTDPCTGTGKCTAQGTCSAPPVDCNDFNDCTQDACDAGGSCVHVPVAEGQTCIYPSTAPGAQDICVPLGKCDAGGTCKAGQDQCGCHLDSDCKAKDKDLCDGLLTCQLTGQIFDCVPAPGTAVVCNTGADTTCRKAKCEPASGECFLSDVANGTSCSDGNACTLGDSCLAGSCSSGLPVDCDDSNDCTTDSCEPATGCKHVKVPAGSPCSDDEPCSIGDKCDNSGFCVPGAPKTPACVDSDVCTEDTCTEDGTKCLFPPILGCCKNAGDCSLGQVCYQQSCCGPVCEDGEIGKFECGDDSCGSSCGVCSGTAVCANRKCCTPNCTSPPKSCGEDGCGGSCGTCGAGEVCTAGFLCCKPNCVGRVCGSDGCGGTCGSCQVGYVCAEGTGTCQACTPSCEGKSCGPDGCGGTCGNCPSGQPCLPEGTCCVPDCNGLECGDNGCGGTCGTCAAWEECSNGLCECGKCCNSDIQCGALEDCSGTIPGGTESICKEKLRLFFEGFEGQTPGQPSPTFKYSYPSANPWSVKQAADQFGAHTGSYSLRYYRVLKDDNYFYRSVWMPSVPAEGRTLVSFFVRCASDKIAWSMEVSLGGQVATTLNNTTCDGFWHRFVADVSTQPSGKADLKFRMIKNVASAVDVLIDDVAILVSACPEPIECASWSAVAGECKQSAVAPDKCFIDLVCYPQGAVNPDVSCAICKPSSNNQDWTPDNSLCNDGNPLTTDICDVKSTKGCYSF